MGVSVFIFGRCSILSSTDSLEEACTDMGSSQSSISHNNSPAAVHAAYRLVLPGQRLKMVKRFIGRSISANFW